MVIHYLVIPTMVPQHSGPPGVAGAQAYGAFIWKTKKSSVEMSLRRLSGADQVSSGRLLFGPRPNSLVWMST